MRRVLTLLAVFLVLGTVSASALPSDVAVVVAPVKCAADDVTADGRVFPEPKLSQTFLSLSDFECGVKLLNSQHADRINITTLGKSAAGHPIYDIRLTNEKIPLSEKRHLLVLSSIHGNEHAGREGGARVIEDMLDAKQLGGEKWVKSTLKQFVVHFVFPNPDGWVNGDITGREGAGANYSRQNNGTPRRDLSRNFPVVGYLRASNGTVDQPEGKAIDALLQRYADQRDSDDPDYRGWYLGTDNHGQNVKPVAASGLQIVGQFDFEKSERLAHFADGINGAMAEYDVLSTLEELNQATGGRIKPYEWGTLYDILGYSASGSGIDYYNTPTGVNGTGFATEMTASNLPFSNMLTHPGLVNQMWVDSTRAINYTMFKDAIKPIEVEFPIGGRVAYIYDPAVTTDDDVNGMGTGNAAENVPSNFTGDKDPSTFSSYSVSRMKFFADLNQYAERPLEPLRVGAVLKRPGRLSAYDSLVIADRAKPEAGSDAAWVSALRTFVQGGGNLVVTDGAAPLLDALFDDIAAGDITVAKADVGYVDFGDRAHPMNRNLRGVASQTYDVIPIGYPDNAGAAPNWRVKQTAWDAAGGYTAGTNGSGQTIYGARPLGKGQVTFLGALLPEPTEDYFHPFGLQNYAVTYTGYTLLENMLSYERD
jgi:Zinc carboxypeptidase